MQKIRYTYAKPDEGYFFFRWRCLRSPLGMPLGSEKDEQEHLAIHLMAELETGTAAVCRVQLENKGTARLRYMATDPKHQGKGYGKGLLEFAMEVAKKDLEAEKMVLDARTSASGFYAACGFSPQGAPFEKVGIPHLSMVKML